MNVVVNSRSSVIKKVISGEISFGISSKRIDRSELEYKELFDDKVILIASANHPWAGYRYVYPDDLLDEPIILREEGAGTLEIMLDGFSSFDITPDLLNVAMVLGNAEAIEISVEESLGIAFISKFAAI